MATIDTEYRDHLVAHCGCDISLEAAIEAATLFCRAFLVRSVIVHYQGWIHFQEGDKVVCRYGDKFIHVTRGGVPNYVEEGDLNDQSKCCGGG